MTKRERLIAAARGGEVDRKPVVVWSASPGHQADGICVAPTMVAEAVRSHAEQMILVEIMSPCGLGRRRGIPLTRLLREEPEEGRAAFVRLRDYVEAQIDRAFDEGADGIYYRLDGAYPAMNTPMEYGGFYLETDREFLERVQDAPVNLLHVEGQEDVYFDCVADLPAALFGWDRPKTGVSVAEMRTVRSGALAAEDPEADVLLVKHYDIAERILKDLEQTS